MSFADDKAAALTKLNVALAAVAALTPDPVSPPVVVIPPSPSGSYVPKPLPKVRFQSDLSKSFPEGGFGSSDLAKQFLAYSGFGDTSKVNGWYDTAGISVHDGMIDLHFKPDSQGRLRAVCLIPDQTRSASWPGTTFLYGQVDVTLNIPVASRTASIHVPLMLWADPWIELDALETNFDGNVYGFVHEFGPNPKNNIAQGGLPVPIADGKDHTVTMSWTPNGVSAAWDGQVYQAYPKPWANVPLRPTLQFESNGRPNAGLDVHAYIKSVIVSQP